MESIQSIVENAELPHGMRWYTVGGQTAFPMYCASGGLRGTMISYLYKRSPLGFIGGDLGCESMRLKIDVGGAIIAVMFDAVDDLSVVAAKINKAIEILKYA